MRSDTMNWRRYIRAIVIVWATVVCLGIIRFLTIGMPTPVNIVQVPIMLVIHFFSFAALGTIFFLPQFFLLHRLNRDSRVWCILLASIGALRSRYVMVAMDAREKAWRREIDQQLTDLRAGQPGSPYRYLRSMDTSQPHGQLGTNGHS